MAGRVKSRGFPAWLVAAVALIAVGWFLAGGSLDLDSDSSGTVSLDTTIGVDTRFSDLGIVTIDDLPAEADTTLDLIASGGPYPFARDDAIFQNRERLLPLRPDGHYREYTVITPGEDDRGARRIVAGADGELYYTDDHYASFREIVGVGS